jgi:hypothetical protein
VGSGDMESAVGCDSGIAPEVVESTVCVAGEEIEVVLGCRALVCVAAVARAGLVVELVHSVAVWTAEAELSVREGLGVAWVQVAAQGLFAPSLRLLSAWPGWLSVR